MSLLGDLWGGFTGESQKKYTNEAFANSTRELQQGRDKGLDAYGQGYSQAQGYLSPYATQGGQANNLYGTYLGLNGADAQRSALQNYAGADPFRQFNEDQANRGLARQFNKMGMLDSGNSRLAMSRASLERGSQDYNNYLGRLSQLGQQGMGAAGQLGGYAMQNGGNIANLWNNYGTTQAGNEIQKGNALSQASGIFGNNLMKVVPLAAAAATGNWGALAGMGGMFGGQNDKGGYQQGGSGGSNYWGFQNRQ